MAYIGKKPEDKFRGLASYDTFTGDGSTTTFDVTNVLPDGGTYDVEVFVDNVRQEGGSGKSYTIGNDGNGDLKRITFAVAPDNAAEIYVINPGRNTAVVTVTDNSLTAAKLQTDAVTTAKIQDDAVTSAKIADGTIVSSNIAPGTIANDRLANTGITINGTSIALGASGEIVAGTDWQAVTVADGSTTLNATAGAGYFLDTNTGVIEVNLPTSPTRGDTIILMDYAGTFATNQCIVNTGTTNLDSTTTRQYKLTTNDTIAEFVYVDSSKGWVTRINTTTGTTPSGAFTNGVYDIDPQFIVATGGTITTSGDYKTHIFTGDGCFTVSSIAPAPSGNPNNVDYLVVGGGGGAPNISAGDGTGGGGGGGMRFFSTAPGSNSPLNNSGASPNTEITATATAFPITVGAGGTSSCNPGTAGSPSTFSTVTSAGGGLGGYISATGGSGGSGGGAGGGDPGSDPGGAGNTPPVSPPQGQNGGTGGGGTPNNQAGGGGGAGGVGGNKSGTSGGNGGPGSYIADPFIGPTAPSYGTPGPVGSTRYFAGGGGGAGRYGFGAAGTGGGGIGSSGSSGPSQVSSAGTVNTGGGGGGGSDNRGGQNGGSGIVMIRYKFQ